MAFINSAGKAVSFECSNLIEELKRDIAEFGKNMQVDVVTEERAGVKIYKDYNFASDKLVFPDLKPSEKTERMTAMELLRLYEKENAIF